MHHRIIGNRQNNPTLVANASSAKRPYRTMGACILGLMTLTTNVGCKKSENESSRETQSIEILSPVLGDVSGPGDVQLIRGNPTLDFVGRIPTQGGRFIATVMLSQVVPKEQVKIFDSGGRRDVTEARLSIPNSTVSGIEIDLGTPKTASLRYVLVVYPNDPRHEKKFSLTYHIDATVPVTKASELTTKHTKPFTVDLLATDVEPATVYYSMDGSTPVVIPDPPSAVGIPIFRSTSLKFFSVDIHGNRESLQTINYVFPAPAPVDGLVVKHRPTDQLIRVIWQGRPGLKYHVYRAKNLYEHSLLVDSVRGQVPPPEHLRLKKGDGVSQSNFNDSTIVPGSRYWYTVTAVSTDRRESIAALKGTKDNGAPIFFAINLQNVDLEIPDLQTARKRADHWLRAQQLTNGYWGQSQGERIRVTTQVLGALQAQSRSSPAKNNSYDHGIAQALHRLKGEHPQNNDDLARVLWLFAKFRIRSPRLVFALEQGADREGGGSTILGWGITSDFRADPIRTALGWIALKAHGTEHALDTSVAEIGANLHAAAAGRYGWISSGVADYYAHALVLHSLRDWNTAALHRYPQNSNTGGIGASVQAVASALLWPNGFQEIDRQKARQYLQEHQDKNGSWSDDPFLTALCLEALQTSVVYEDAKGDPSVILAGWTTLENTPSDASINRVLLKRDGKAYDYAIELTPSPHPKKGPLDSAFKTTPPWRDTQRKFISWRMQAKSDFVVAIPVQTDAGPRLLKYLPKEMDPQRIDAVAGTLIEHGLGVQSDTEWVTITRDLQKDLRDVLAGETLLRVEELQAVGHVLFDDIRLHEGMASGLK